MVVLIVAPATVELGTTVIFTAVVAEILPMLHEAEATLWDCGSPDDHPQKARYVMNRKKEVCIILVVREIKK